MTQKLLDNIRRNTKLIKARRECSTNIMQGPRLFMA
ncbi:Uncharacterised protein [Vibrio cholerae]|nr:Uncharacterised protein [Vibrio cholerae]